MTTNLIEDIELLERAAHVAGIRLDATKSVPHPISSAFFGLWLTFDGEPPEGARRYWNPLRDDGDCARLEAALELDVLWGGDCATVRRLRREGHITPFERFCDHNGDKQAARRRAAVRAAAAFASRT